MPRPNTLNMRPRDAATLLIYDTNGKGDSNNEYGCNRETVRILMGKRHSRHIFLPGKFVFPGGRVEPRDYCTRPNFRLPDGMIAKLLKHCSGTLHPRRAYALVQAALRETFEETGLIVAGYVGDGNTPEPADMSSEGRKTLDNLTFLARAITPPRRPKRFDTRFFALPARYIDKDTGGSDGEFSCLRWLTLEEAYAENLPAITRAVLDDFSERLVRPFSSPASNAELVAQRMNHMSEQVPYYFMRGACYHRRTL
ncbi:MAG: NUDIX hydrolase [Alphaproteobacteria bacterium]